MNKLIICVDMDDTIEDLRGAWVDWLNQKYNRNVLETDILNWDICSYYPGLTTAEVFAPLSEGAFWKTVKPKVDAMQYLKILYDEGHDIYICTASHPDTVKYKFNEIIKKYFSFIDWKHMIIASTKQMIRCDVMIDDNPDNLRLGHYKQILFKATPNKEFFESNHGLTMRRAENWDDVYKIITELYNDNRGSKYYD